MEALEKLVLQGDLAKLSPAEKVQYYVGICDALGLDPRTQPFAYLKLQGREILYATRSATDQLRRLHQVSIQIVHRERLDGDIYAVVARATTPDGRTDEAIGVVNVRGLSGEALANAYMKAETKAKRRVTLSICGLGMMDETEAQDIPGAEQVPVLPPAQDQPQATPAQDQPQTAQMITAGQRARLMAICQRLGLDRQQRLELASRVLGRPISSANELTRHEAAALMDYLQQQLLAKERADAASA